MKVNDQCKAFDDLFISYCQMFEDAKKFAAALSKYDHKRHVPPDDIRPDFMRDRIIEESNITITENTDYETMDDLLRGIESQIKRLNEEKAALYEVRYQKMAKDKPQFRYEFYNAWDGFIYVKVRIYIDNNGRSELVLDDRMLSEEPPFCSFTFTVPDDLKPDLIALWKKALKEKDGYEEKLEKEKKQREEEERKKREEAWKKQEEERKKEQKTNWDNFWGQYSWFGGGGTSNLTLPDNIRKKFIRQLQKANHPDNNGGGEAFSYVQQLKAEWGV